MKIKTDSNKNFSRIAYLALFLILISLLLPLKKYSKYLITEGNNDIDNPTTILTKKKYVDVIKNDINIIHSDSIFSIYLNNLHLKPTLFFVYKDSLQKRQKEDWFFVHVHLNDTKKLANPNPQNFKYLSLDFPPTNIDSIKIDNQKYFIFKKEFNHNGYLGQYIDLSNVSFINTGRYGRGTGLGRLHEAKNLKVNKISPVNISDENDLDKISLFINKKDFNKIKLKRDNAIKNGVLITDENDLANAQISINNSKKLKSKVRLKGDWTDHLLDQKKWSFRIILEDDETLNGMRKFSLQHPKTRNYLWEWLFNKVVKKNEIIGLRYDFVDLEINLKENDSIQNMQIGIMAIEESFDKILIENNKRREGIVIAFDESLMWKDREKQYHLNLEKESGSANLGNITRNAPIKVYNESKVLSDPKLLKQFHVAKDLLTGLRTGKLKISEVFDVDKLTMFVALTNLFGGGHGIVDHNLRIYFNPITNKLEPISFDSYSGVKLNKLVDYPFSSNDIVYTEKLLEKLKIVSSSDFINDLANEFSNELSGLSKNLNREFTAPIDLTTLEYNSNFIKKKINPSDVIVSNLLKYDESEMSVEIANLSDFPVNILGLEHEDGKKLNDALSSNIIGSGESKSIDFKLKKSFVNAFVSKKNKKGNFRYPKDVKKLKINYTIIGLDHQRKSKVIPYGRSKELDKNIKDYSSLFRPNYDSFAFVSTEENEKTILFKSGVHTLNNTIIIPTGLKVVIEEGFELDFKDNASIISFSPIIANGSDQKHIKFFSSDSTGGGIFVTNTMQSSKLDFCYFSNLTNPSSNNWELSGAVNFHESNVDITNSVFENNRSEDGLNIIKSEFVIRSTVFRNTYSDAFDGDFVKGKIQDCEFVNCGNDGIDVSGSQIDISNIVIKQPSDKAISGGEASNITGNEIHILGGEIGIVSKDLSKIELSDVIISDTRLGLSSFQKKSEFGVGVIEISNLKLVNNELDYLIENGSRLSIDNVPVITVSNNVIDQMYGKEYGKSSK